VNDRHSRKLKLASTGAVIAIGACLLALATQLLDRGAVGAVEGKPSTPEQIAQIKLDAAGYSQTLVKDPNNQAALKGLLDARLQLGDIKGSIAPLAKIAALNPQQPDYTILLAQTRQYLNDREGAASDYRSVLLAQPQNIYALQGLTSLLIDAKRPEAAMGAVKHALAVPTTAQPNGTNPDLTPIKLLEAQILLAQHQNADALAIYDESIRVTPTDFRPVLAKALVYKQIGNLSEAKALMSRAMAIAPTDYKDRIYQMIDRIELPKTNGG
jgi:tetratricopeptide (TPR) repeat protein